MSLTNSIHDKLTIQLLFFRMLTIKCVALYISKLFNDIWQSKAPYENFIFASRLILDARALGGTGVSFSWWCIYQGCVNGHLANIRRHAAMFNVILHTRILRVDQALEVVTTGNSKQAKRRNNAGS